MKTKAKTAQPITRDIEEKFAKTAFRLNQERNDFFLPQVQDFVKRKKWINLRPEYQRRLVWDDKKRSLFIESLLLNVPVPPVFLYEWDLSRYEVMDGQQRLNSIVDFYNNLFALRGLERWGELNGMRFRDLPGTLQRGLDRRRISATVLLVEGARDTLPERRDIRKLVFERLNTGGQQLRPQELRNCLYEGKFNEALISLARNPVFTDIWGIPCYEKNVDKHGNLSKELRENRLYRRMEDCELVLRFFAFRKKSSIKGAVRRMLDKCMEDHLHDTDEDVSRLKDEYIERIVFAKDVFGTRVFRHEDENGQSQLSEPLYDGTMVALDRLWARRTEIKSAKVAVNASIANLLKRKPAIEVILGKPNTSAAVLKRMDLLTKAISSAL